MRAQIIDRDIEQLSAYLDEQLSSGEKRKLEDRLRARPDLQTALDDLRRTKMLLRAAPRRRAPRNFTLTPAMVGKTGPQKRSSGFLGLFPALSFTSALAAFALVASLVFELLPGMNASLANVRQEKAAVMLGSPAATQPVQETGRTLMQDSAAEIPAATAPPGVAAAPAPTEMKALEQASEEQSPAGMAPVIVWNPGVNLGSGGGSPEASKFPGAGVSPGYGGGPAASLGMSPSGGVIVVPLEGINSMNTAQPAAQAEVEAAPLALKEGSPAGGGGPILGIPPADQGGEITASSGWGEPLSVAPVEQPDQAPLAGELRSLPGVPPVRLVQLLLGLLAVLTGAAAYLLRKR